jgi:RNA-directed DNA polymerase
MCWSRSQAEAALARLTALPAGLGLEPKAAKTRIVHLEEGGGGFDFPGFHHRMVRSRGLNGKETGSVPGPLALGQGHAACP